MPNLRGKTWTETTPAKTEDANFWESHLIDDESYEGLQDLLEGGAGGGHVIVNGAGTDMPQQPKLQFVNATVTNGNGVTIVSGNGEKGDAATVTVGTTTTGAAGTNASVTNSGTEYDAVLNFVIPRGADGEGVPSGGTTGQVLTKASNTDGDVTWTTPAGGATWGSITGTLSNQTDLQNALDSAGKVKAVDGFNPDTTTGNVTTERVLTQAQYDALTPAEQNNGMTYYISDGAGGGSTTASQVTYSNTQSGLSATKVQGAIDEVVSNTLHARNINTNATSGVSVAAYSSVDINTGIAPNANAITYAGRYGGHPLAVITNIWVSGGTVRFTSFNPTSAAITLGASGTVIEFYTD